jgi:hypothetical protein
MSFRVLQILFIFIRKLFPYTISSCTSRVSTRPPDWYYWRQEIKMLNCWVGRRGMESMPSLINISRWGGDRHVGIWRGEGSMRNIGDLSNVDADDGLRRLKNEWSPPKHWFWYSRQWGSRTYHVTCQYHFVGDMSVANMFTESLTVIIVIINVMMMMYFFVF